MFCESDTEQLMLSGLGSEASDEEKKRRRLVPGEDLPMPSTEHQQEQMLSPKKNLKPCKDSSAAEKSTGPGSGLVLEHSEKCTSFLSKHYEENNESSDNSEDLQCPIKNLVSDKIGRQKIVSFTQLSFLSGRLLISGIAGAEAEPHRKNKQKRRHKWKGAETRSEIAKCLDISLADTSKPTSIVDPVTNQEVLLGNGYNICNLLNDGSVLHFTIFCSQLFKNTFNCQNFKLISSLQ
ncbi:UNVERIFIED_CONTAM: hypothetical protein H355_001496 [Colinus virginianus]|nr:hypothetical protein H355_001496 [Colinus virginianus]